MTALELITKLKLAARDSTVRIAHPDWQVLLDIKTLEYVPERGCFVLFTKEN